MIDIKNYLLEMRQEVETYLATILPIADAPIPLSNALHYALLGGGKRIRAILAISVGRALKGKKQNIFPVAAAMEMIHAYSLVHDDLPAMDDDDFRRGKPSTHKKFGEAMGILTGDALVTHAFWLVAAQTQEKHLVAPLVEVVAWAAGVGGMVSGQVADILAEQDNLPENIVTGCQNKEELLNYIHHNKTAALIYASCEAGAIAAGTDSEKRQQIKKYGKNIGLAFQIMDDILDITSTTEQLGKTVGKDANVGKLTYPACYGIEESKQRANQLVEEAIQQIVAWPNNEYLVDLAQFITSRDH